MERLAKDMVDVLGVRFHRVTVGEAMEKILHWTGDGNHHMVITAGPEFVMQCRETPELLSIVNSADLVTADGIGVVWAAARGGRPVPERVTGVELLPATFREAQTRRHALRVFIVGATQESLDACLRLLRQTYPAVLFAGHNGFFQASDMAELVAQVRQFGPNLLLVGMGQPRQERLLRQILGRLEPCVGIGIGGSIDVWGGTVARAPTVFQKLNIEWLYRLLSQPQRWRRQMALPKFAMSVIRQRRK